MSRKRHHHRTLKPRVRRRTQPGASPGTLQVDAKSPPSHVQVIAYNASRLIEKEIADVTELVAMLREWPVVWANVDGLGDVTTLQQVADIFRIHPLAMEDVVHVHQRPKVEPYQRLLYCVVKMPHVNGERITEQVSFFLGEGFVVTFQEQSGDCFDLIRRRLRSKESRMRKETRADYLAYRLIDAIVDAYFPVMEQMGNRLDILDERAGNDADHSVFAELHVLRRELLMLRRAVWPLRDAITELRAEGSEFIDEQTRLYLRDCHDHVVQVIDLLESYREICTDLRDFYLSSISNRMNEVMKTLTVIATIFIPLSFIAGLYGMNFDTEVSPWNMPELHWILGYPFALGLMAAVAGGMLMFFRRRGWLGGGRRESTNNHDQLR